MQVFAPFISDVVIVRDMATTKPKPKVTKAPKPTPKGGAIKVVKGKKQVID